MWYQVTHRLLSADRVALVYYCAGPWTEAGYAKWQKVDDLYEKIAVGFSEASVDSTKHSQRAPPLPKPAGAVIE